MIGLEKQFEHLRKWYVYDQYIFFSVYLLLHRIVHLKLKPEKTHKKNNPKEATITKFPTFIQKIQN